MLQPIDHEHVINKCLDEFNASADGVAARLVSVGNHDFDIEIISQNLDNVVFSSADDLMAKFKQSGLRGELSWFTKTDFDKMMVRFRI